MTQASEIRILSQDDIYRALPMAKAVEAMREAFLLLSQDRATMPARTHINIPHQSATALCMPVYTDYFNTLSVKVVSIFPHNPEKALPCIQGLVCLLDGDTGTPLALLNGSCLTALRTGAASGVATDLLARPDATQVAILGAGIQARTQLEAVCSVRSVQRVWVYDIIPEAAAAFAREMGAKLAVDVAVAACARDAIRSAHVLCTATVSSTPVFDPADISPGMHINAIGSYQPHVQEIPAETVLQARVFVDHLDAALQETGDLIIPLQEGLMQPTHIQAELGDIVAGKAEGRTGDHDITLFKSVGVAIQDLAAATRAVERAQAEGLGSVVNY